MAHITNYTDIGEARAVAERLAQERGQVEGRGLLGHHGSQYPARFHHVPLRRA
jgi:hypothetical protein